MKISSKKLLTSALLFALAAPLAVVAEDLPAGAWAGTWVATSKSKFPGPAPKLDQVTIDPDGKAAIHVESPDGKITDWSYKPQVGKFIPIDGRDGVTVQVVKVSDYRLNQIWKKNGKITRSHSTLSKDGKTQIFYAAPGKDKDGKPFQEVVVYEKK
jgi:hypothetical protein